MEQEKQVSGLHEKDLSHVLVASGHGVVVEYTGTDADARDMYRMGKVQQMQVRRSESE